MKSLGIIKSEYLFKTIENLFFVEITLYKIIKDKMDKKNKSKNSKSKKEKSNQRSKTRKKRYPVIRSRHALLFNSLIMISYVLTSGIVMGLTFLGKLTLVIYKFVKKKVKGSKQTICTDDTVSSLDDLIVDYSKVVDFQKVLEAKKLEQSKKALP